MSEQQRSIAVPKRFQAPMKDIWILARQAMLVVRASALTKRLSTLNLEPVMTSCYCAVKLKAVKQPSSPNGGPISKKHHAESATNDD